MIWQDTLTFSTPRRGTYNITREIEAAVAASSIRTGLCNLFIQHTSASLIVTENADPSVRRDIEYWLQKTVIDGDPHYEHNYEGDDDMSGHIRTLLTETSLSVPVSQGRLALGTWQGIFIYEHRTGRFNRKVVVTIHGE
ncbi:secondary thiamine-phosphate synthase enzyme [Sulfurivirga caldicuralii]|uniref:Secondary thiamine-phosphate synthase enzyme n=1 Tax=Sulfurivirga caldicuralii TaxID=364032 RepID=A0A1N6HBP5_9GAMM|nr:secondary thiamine-phosphate synthase enzyme YjbQ [Sulfurivirga caldicuralii]SIO17244.1 secondary thiamine-phosphate synthase enzyme [Sulfurivirga caldicuralii]